MERHQGEDQRLFPLRKEDLSGFVYAGLIRRGQILHGDQHVSLFIKLVQNCGELGGGQAVSGVVICVVVSVKGAGGVGNERLEGNQGNFSHIFPDRQPLFGRCVVGDGLGDLVILAGAGAQKGQRAVIVVLRGENCRFGQKRLVFLVARRGLPGCGADGGIGFVIPADQLDAPDDEGDDCRDAQ